MNVGKEGKLELQPGVGTGMVEEADIFSLEERLRDIKPGPVLPGESQVLPSWGPD